MPAQPLLFAMTQVQTCDSSIDQVQQLFDLKLAMATSIGLFALVAEATTELHGWEDLSLKGLLIGAVVYLIRAQAQDRKEHRAELAAAWEEHKKDSHDREIKYNNILEANTKVLSDLTRITEEQTTYFKTVTRTIVDERLKTKPLP